MVTTKSANNMDINYGYKFSVRNVQVKLAMYLKLDI